MLRAVQDTNYCVFVDVPASEVTCPPDLPNRIEAERGVVCSPTFGRLPMLVCDEVGCINDDAGVDAGADAGDAGVGVDSGTDAGVCDPANEEVCNGVDDDCDGAVDEGVRSLIGPLRRILAELAPAFRGSANTQFMVVDDEILVNIEGDRGNIVVTVDIDGAPTRTPTEVPSRFRGVRFRPHVDSGLVVTTGDGEGRATLDSISVDVLAPYLPEYRIGDQLVSVTDRIIEFATELEPIEPGFSLVDEEVRVLDVPSADDLYVIRGELDPEGLSDDRNLLQRVTLGPPGLDEVGWELQIGTAYFASAVAERAGERRLLIGMSLAIVPNIAHFYSFDPASPPVTLSKTDLPYPDSSDSEHYTATVAGLTSFDMAVCDGATQCTYWSIAFDGTPSPPMGLDIQATGGGTVDLTLLRLDETSAVLAFSTRDLSSDSSALYFQRIGCAP